MTRFNAHSNPQNITEEKPQLRAVYRTFEVLVRNPNHNIALAQVWWLNPDGKLKQLVAAHNCCNLCGVAPGVMLTPWLTMAPYCSHM